jgi:hypothetical protein
VQSEQTSARGGEHSTPLADASTSSVAPSEVASVHGRLATPAQPWDPPMPRPTPIAAQGRIQHAATPTAAATSRLAKSACSTIT